MKNLAIITARGNSKRIPKKNIKEFCGRPIIAYTIIAALDSGLFDEVMVSTDSEEIAKIAKEYGASVPFYRGEYTSGDFATMYEVLTEVVGEYEKRGIEFENYCSLYPTAPFVTAERLRDAYRVFTESSASMLQPLVRFSFPPQRGVRIKDGAVEFVYPENALKRSQDLEPMYHDCGQFYFFSNTYFDKDGNRIHVKTTEINPPKRDLYNEKGELKKIVAYVMPEIEVQDIDTMEDWEIAEVKYKILHGNTGE